MVLVLLAGIAVSSIAFSIVRHIHRRQKKKRAMGLIKLAIIGGAAYYAGKKMNENNSADGQTNNGWGCNGRWKEQKRQQIMEHMEQTKQRRQLPEQGPGMTRGIARDTTDDYVYNHHSEKPQQQPQQQSQTEPQYQVLYTAEGRPVEVGNGWWPTYAQPTPTPKNREVAKVHENNVTSTVTEVKEVSTPPAYAGHDRRSVSPQQRMWPGMWVQQPAGEKM